MLRLTDELKYVKFSGSYFQENETKKNYFIKIVLLIANKSQAEIDFQKIFPSLFLGTPTFRIAIKFLYLERRL